MTSVTSPDMLMGFLQLTSVEREEPPVESQTEQMTVKEFVPHVVSIVQQAPGEVVFTTAVTAEGFVADCHCFSSPDRPKASLPREAIFWIAEDMGAPSVFITTRAEGSSLELHYEDFDMTRELIQMGRAKGIELVDHVIVYDDGHRSLRETTTLWS